MERHACGLLLAGLLVACSGGGGATAGTTEAVGTVADQRAAAAAESVTAAQATDRRGHQHGVDDDHDTHDHGVGPGGSDGSGGSAEETIVEDRTPGLAGTDADGNGIRDDIDQLIIRRYAPTPEARRAAEQKARALRQMLMADTREDALRAVRQLMRSTTCLYRALPDGSAEADQLRLSLSRELQAWTANTRERLTHYMRANQLAGGGYFARQPEPVCD